MKASRSYVVRKKLEGRLLDELSYSALFFPRDFIDEGFKVFVSGSTA